MKCPKCQTEVASDDKFCRECGHDLRKPLEALSKAYRQPHSYTPKHLSDRILTTRSSIEGERKLVTVLFADVADYTAMAEKLNPERVHQIMDGCFKILMDEIHRYEGTINQFTGDGIMALFGAPLAHEDHAQRACLAALGIQENLQGYGKELNSKDGLDFRMRMGLNSGPVVVGSIGDDLRMDYTAIGDTTNLAFRMQALAKPGSTLVSPHTYRIVKQSFEFTSLGKVDVKGKEEAVEVYRLRSRRGVYRPRLGLEREIYSEMVGRERELDLLEFQLQKAVNGEGSIVNIIGEAGIGKSRLVAELKNRDVMKKVALLEGRAISIGRNLSFHPIVDLLKHWVRIREDDTELKAFDRLRSAITGICVEATDEVLPFIATLMGMKLHGRYAERIRGIQGEALEKLILKSVRDLLIKATEVTPLVIVTEDLHWADTSSIELLESLFRVAETQRIVFVNVFRPGHEETGDRIQETVKEDWPGVYTEIPLRPLDERMSVTLINNMLNIAGLTHGVRNQIVQRAGGNPFFIEEVVRSLIDEGAVVSKHGSFEVTEKINDVVIPQTINDVLMARIDRLEEKTRDLVKLASVIGRSFFYRILAEVARTIDDMDQRLSYLKGIQFIRERRRMEELEYLFKHALAQEAAYASILAEKRKELHLKVAGSIENVFTERLHEFYGTLAYHYGRGEDEDKAEEYLIKAGEEALRTSASGEALYSFREALNLYLRKYGDAVDPARVAMLEKNIAIALHSRGQFVEAAEYFEKALIYYGEKSPKRLLPLSLRFFVCFLHYLVSLYFPSVKFRKIATQQDNEILDLILRKSEALLVTDARRSFIESLYGLRRMVRYDLSTVKNGIKIFTGPSAIFSWAGISFRLSKRVLELVKPRIDKNDASSAAMYATCNSTCNYLAGCWGTIEEYDPTLVDRALSTGEVFEIAVYTVFHGYLNLDRGLLADAQRIADRLSEIADTYEHDHAKASYYGLYVKFLMKQRRFNNALVVADEGSSITDRVGLGAFSCYLYALRSRILTMKGDITVAEESLGRATRNLKEAQQIPFFLGAFFISQFMMELHRLEESIQVSEISETGKQKRRALKTGRKMLKKSGKVAGDSTEALRLMGRYYWLIGKQKKALNWWRRSIREGERLGARLELSRTYMEVGRHLLDTKSRYRELNGLGSEDYLKKARTMFQEMDLQWDLDELERICPVQ